MLRRIVSVRFSPPWYDAIVWFCYTVLGLFVTVIIGGLAAAATGRFELGAFTDGGQFGVYTAGMLVSIQYIVHRPNPLKLPSTEWFGFWIVLLLFLSASIVVLASLAVHDLDIDKAWLRLPGIGLFILSMALAFVAVGLDNVRTQVNPKAESERAIERLREQFSQSLAEEDR